MSTIIDCYEMQHADELKASELEEKTMNYLPNKELLEAAQSMTSIIDRYEMQHADELKATELEFKTMNYLPNKELLEAVQSKEPNLNNASVDSLISLEEHLETALSVTRARKAELMMEHVKTLQEKEKLLREENLRLASQIGKKKFLEGEDEGTMSSN